MSMPLWIVFIASFAASLCIALAWFRGISAGMYEHFLREIGEKLRDMSKREDIDMGDYAIMHGVVAVVSDPLSGYKLSWYNITKKSFDGPQYQLGRELDRVRPTVYNELRSLVFCAVMSQNIFFVIFILSMSFFKKIRAYRIMLSIFAPRGAQRMDAFIHSAPAHN